MAKLVSISVMSVLLGLPVAGPLLARAPCTCCAHGDCQLAFRSTSCCRASAIPDTTIPAHQAITWHLAAPAVVPLPLNAGSPLVGLAESPTYIPYPSHAVLLTVPLRI
jgi:hypothetical protein